MNLNVPTSVNLGGALAAGGALLSGGLSVLTSALSGILGTKPASTDVWPLSKFYFRVNIGGSSLSFQSCEGLDATIAVMEFRDGNSINFYKEKRPTMVSFSPVTLKKGVFAGNTDFYKWFKGVAFDNFFGDMRTVTIELLNTESNTPAVMWTLEKAFVTKFTPTPLDAEADTEPAVEEIEISYQSFSTSGGIMGAIGSALSAVGL